MTKVIFPRRASVHVDKRFNVREKLIFFYLTLWDGVHPWLACYPNWNIVIIRDLHLSFHWKVHLAYARVISSLNLTFVPLIRSSMLQAWLVALEPSLVSFILSVGFRPKHSTIIFLSFRRRSVMVFWVVNTWKPAPYTPSSTPQWVASFASSLFPHAEFSSFCRSEER